MITFPPSTDPKKLRIDIRTAPAARPATSNSGFGTVDIRNIVMTPRFSIQSWMRAYAGFSWMMKRPPYPAA